jgi:hypothetical protein
VWSVGGKRSEDQILLSCAAEMCRFGSLMEEEGRRPSSYTHKTGTRAISLCNSLAHERTFHRQEQSDTIALAS